MKMKKLLAVIVVLVMLLTAVGGASVGAARAAIDGVKGKVGGLSLVRTASFAAAVSAGVPEQAVNRKGSVNRLVPSKLSGAKAPSALANPTVTPLPLKAPRGFASALGLNSYQNRFSNGYNVTPPDQALCAGNGWVVEAVNDVMRVDTADLQPYSGVASLYTFFGYDSLDPNVGIGDPVCLYDTETRHWFLTTYFFDVSSDTMGTLLAVSVTPDPNGFWNEYLVYENQPAGGNCPCFGDQPLLGASHDALVISTNNFPFYVAGFNGAQLYIFSKQGLAQGLTFLYEVTFDLANDVPPPSAAGGIWYSVQPSTSPDATQYDYSQGGIMYLLSAEDFDGTLDNKLAMWALTNLKSMATRNPDVGLYNAEFISETYGQPPLVDQKDGLHPYGEYNYGDPVGQINSNDDRMNHVTYAKGNVWGAVNTVMDVGTTTQAGIAYFMAKPTWVLSSLNAAVTKQGYIGLQGLGAVFPTFGVTAKGKAVLVFSIAGLDMWPSAAYTKLSLTAKPAAVFRAAQGQAPLDDFCEYPLAGCGRPRFGDYSAAAVVGSTVYIATEYVQYPACDVAAWSLDRTCGGTRGTATNWGTMVANVKP